MKEFKSIEKMSFEDALSELETIVKKIDTGEENLADAVTNFERGILLRNHCKRMVEEARLKIEKITKSSDNEIDISEIEI